MKLLFLCIFIAATTAENKVATKYLPPQEKTVSEFAEVAVEPIVTTEATAVLGDDGYRYKTVRRLKYRHRRDISEVAKEYLPPAVENPEKDYLPPSEEETSTEVAVVSEAPQDTAVLADDGYHYKTVRRLRYRQRRDVSEVAGEYLPPAENSVENEYLPPSEEAVTETVATPEVIQDTAVLADDGYHYKTVRRLKFRQRRDVSELANQYLPPSEEVAKESAEVVDEPQDTAVLGKDGYQYKTVRRLKYRQRRDVSEISKEYLPPAEEVATEVVPEAVTPQDTAVLRADGYQYKTVHRLKFRTRRDVSEIVEPTNDYLPPSGAAVIDIPVLPENALEVEQDTALLKEDGYHYKQPAEAFNLATPSDLPIVDDDTIVVESPDESATALKKDAAYRFRTIKRLKY